MSSAAFLNTLCHNFLHFDRYQCILTSMTNCCFLAEKAPLKNCCKCLPADFLTRSSACRLHTPLATGADLRQKAASVTLPERPPLPSLLLPPLFPPSPLPSPSPPLITFSLPSPPLEVGPKIQLRLWGSTVRSPSGVWGRAPAEIEFGAF